MADYTRLKHPEQEEQDIQVVVEELEISLDHPVIDLLLIDEIRLMRNLLFLRQRRVRGIVLDEVVEEMFIRQGLLKRQMDIVLQKEMLLNWDLRMFPRVRWAFHRFREHGLMVGIN
jgi:hypothetical protein